MYIFINIFLSFCIFYGIYIIGTAVISSHAGKELKRRGCSCDDKEISIYADSENVEYCIRAAIAESVFKVKKITVNVPSSSPERERTAEIAERFRRKYKNIKINYN